MEIPYACVALVRFGSWSPTRRQRRSRWSPRRAIVRRQLCLDARVAEESLTFKCFRRTKSKDTIKRGRQGVPGRVAGGSGSSRRCHDRGGDASGRVGLLHPSVAELYPIDDSFSRVVKQLEYKREGSSLGRDWNRSSTRWRALIINIATQ